MSRVWRQWHVCCRQAHLGRAQQDGALHATTLPVPLTANISAPVTLMGFTSHQIGTRGDLPSANSLSFKFLFTFPMPCKMAGQLWQDGWPHAPPIRSSTFLGKLLESLPTQ